MTKTELWRFSVTELGTAYREGTTTPSEVAEAVLSRIEAVNGVLNAIVAMDAEAIRADAAASTRRLRTGTPRGPLDGVPLVVKDCINVQGLPTSWGTTLFGGAPAEKDETPVARLRDAGMIIVGKTNVPEFALRGFTNNPTYGPTRNPWDSALTSGGSSGGTVSAVAAGFAPVGLGADAGGSIRRPAGFTGLVGLKPSAGRVPRNNALPAIVGDYDVVGPVARNVADLALVHAAIAQPDPGVPGSMAAAPEIAFDAAPRSQRILFIEQFRQSPVDREVASAVATAAKRLEALGHGVETGEAPFDTTAFNRSFGPLSQAGLAWATKDRDWRPHVSDEFRKSIEAGLELKAVDYVAALEIARQFREDMAEVFARYDLIMTPSSATLPWPAAERAHTHINGAPADAGAHSVFTGFANIAGSPGISIPADSSASGLPIGFHLVGRFGDDELLIGIAAQYERAHPWAHRWPSL